MISQDKNRNKIYSIFLENCENSTVTLNDIIQMGCNLMREAKIHSHFFGNNTILANAQYLAFFAKQLPYEYENPQYLHSKLSTDDALKIIALFEKRMTEKIPVEYITNEAFYLDYKFFVNEHVLVPRSIMNTRFQEFLNDVSWENHQVLDLCTGSGCIGISLALLDPNIKVDLVDVSPEALKVAEMNIQKYSLQDRVRCIQSDLFTNVRNKYDLIISNPPYVSTSEYNRIRPEFKSEPKLALESGWDGLTLTHQILTQAKNYLNPKGKIIAEVGFSAARRLKRRYRHVPLKWIKYRKPDGKQSFFAMEGVFMCEAKDLPSVPFSSHRENWIFRAIDKLKDQFY